jgi:AcrR family transcriptional regulator
VPDPVKTRTYRSPVRDEQAAATRAAVLEAARHLFTSAGYAGTTVSDVARRAGVSVDTVYASVGRKPQLLLAVHDMALAGGAEPVEAQARDYVAAVRAAPGARAKLEVYAQALGKRFPTVVPLAESLRVAAERDPACRAVLAALDERRAANMLLMARELRATGDLRADLSDEQVAHLLWATNSAPFYRLATAAGRGPSDYVTMVLDLWSHTLLADAGRPASD